MKQKNSFILKNKEYNTFKKNINKVFIKEYEYEYTQDGDKLTIVTNNNQKVIAASYTYGEEEIERLSYNIISALNTMTDEDILNYISDGFTFEEINFALYLSGNSDLSLNEIFEKLKNGESVESLKSKLKTTKFYDDFSMKEFLPISIGMTQTQVYNILKGKNPSELFSASGTAGPSPIYRLSNGGEIHITFNLNENEYVVSAMTYYENPEDLSQKIELLTSNDNLIPLLKLF